MSRLSIDYIKASSPPAPGSPQAVVPSPSGDGGLVAWQQVNSMSADLYGFPGLLGGLVLSNDGGSPNTIVDISAGACTDSTNQDQILLGAYTKTTGAWALGTGNGALDNGAVAASTWYFVFAIMRIDTDQTDILFSTSATAPVMPASYTLKRRIGAFRTDGSSHILPFYQRGGDFFWKTAVTDVNTTVGTTTSDFSLTVPSVAGIKAYIRAQMSKAATIIVGLVFSPLETGTTAAGVPTGNSNLVAQVAGGSAGADLLVLTDGAGKVRAVSSSAASDITIVTYGWNDPRGA